MNNIPGNADALKNKQTSTDQAAKTAAKLIQDTAQAADEITSQIVRESMGA